MGSIFGFVSSDVRAKVEILEDFRENKEVAEKFESVKKMIVYEKDKELLQKKDYVSGCRTLLRLHRGLGEDCCQFSCPSNGFNDDFYLLCRFY